MKRVKILAASGLLAGLGGVVGCVSPISKLTNSAIVRPQAADDALDADALATIGQKTFVGNTEPIQVSGVGLVYELHGTGSTPPPDQWRTMLEAAIRKQKGDPRKLLDDPSKSTSLVLVSAMIPPGARVGDKLDVGISLPPSSKTSSLKHGVLLTCDLSNSEVAANARQALTQSGVPIGKTPLTDDRSLLMGSRLASAEGPILDGHEGEGDRGRPSARIWGGAKCLLDRPYYLMLNETTPQPRVALVIAERLNAVFHAPGDRGGKLAEAKVQGKPIVVTAVPPAYRLNHGRFLIVARQVPLIPPSSDSPYRKQLEVDLTRPETALVAALKLEALGEGSEQALRVGLESDSPWVRFAAAESLAYLGKASERVAAELAALAEQHPALRTHCLTALASQDDAYCLDQLVELMKKPEPGLRYGAFRSLQSSDPGHEAVRGSKINGTYTLHQVAPESDPMVHVGTDRRAEVVLFGSRWPLQGPFSISLGSEFTIAAKAGELKVTITKVVEKNGEPVAVPQTCRADLGAVLKMLGEMGGTYSDAVELIRKVEKTDVLLASVKYDASPRGMSVQQLAQIARSDPSLQRADLEVERVGSTDTTPTSHDLITEGEAVQAPPTVEPQLNRDPGRLFNTKPNEQGPALNRDPGSLIGKK